MRTQAEISSLLTNPGVIAVVRTQQPEQVLPLCAALKQLAADYVAAVKTAR